MLSYIWPLALIVLSNVFYQICAKEVPGDMNPLASLTVTYFIGAVVSLILYYLTNLNSSPNILKEYSKINWAPFVLGLAIVGLETGYIFAFKNGWEVSSAQLVQGAILAIILIFVGYFLYQEKVTWNKILGIVIVLIGMFFINYNFKK